jgi:hypothetical protein
MGVHVSRVGEVLVHEGAVSSAGLRRALRFQRYGGQGLRLGTILVGWNLADEEALLKALSRIHGCEAASWLDLSRASGETTSLLSAEIAKQVRAIPFKNEWKAVRVAFANPSDLAAIDRVSSVLTRRVIPAVALEIRILQAQALFYGAGIPPDYRPILFKLRDAPDKALARPPTPSGRVIPIVSAPVEPSPVLELLEEVPAPPAPRPPSPADQTRPAVLPPRSPDSRPAGSDTAASFWLTSEGAPEARADDDEPEDSMNPEPPAPPPVIQLASLPRPGREEVARAVLDALLPDMSRALVFGADKDHLFGVYGRGAGIDSSEVQRIHLPPADGSLLQRVRETRAPHFGRPIEEFWPAALAMLLGLDPPECAVFPLENLTGLVGLLYADRDGDRMLERDFDELTRAAAFLANTLGPSRRES